MLSPLPSPLVEFRTTSRGWVKKDPLFNEFSISLWDAKEWGDPRSPLDALISEVGTDVAQLTSAKPLSLQILVESGW